MSTQAVVRNNRLLCMPPQTAVLLGAGVQQCLGVRSYRSPSLLSSVIPMTSLSGIGHATMRDTQERGFRSLGPGFWFLGIDVCSLLPKQWQWLEPCTRNHYFKLLCSVKHLGFCLLSCQIWKHHSTVLSCVMALVNPEVQVQQKSIYKMSLISTDILSMKEVYQQRDVCDHSFYWSRLMKPWF